MRQDHLFDSECMSEETHYQEEFMPEMDVRLSLDHRELKIRWFAGADKAAFRARLRKINKRLLDRGRELV